MKNFSPHYRILVLLLSAAVNTYSQDIIIKNDKTEVKSKVVEITDSHVKYKKWENLDGPLYNITKKEVFMIIYANGQREIIDQSAHPPLSAPHPKSSNKKIEVPKDTISSLPVKDFKNSKVNYNPSRVNIGLQSPLHGSADQEIRVIKNIVNLGFTYDIMPSMYDYYSKVYYKSNFIFFYGSVYAPVNRLSAKYEKQDKGLFPFLHVGYMYSWFVYDGAVTSNAGGVTYRLGTDYFFNETIGISLSTYEFKTFYGGITVKL